GEEHAVGERINAGQVEDDAASVNTGAEVKAFEHGGTEPGAVGVFRSPSTVAGGGVGIVGHAGDPALVIGEPGGGEVEIALGPGRTWAASLAGLDVTIPVGKRADNHVISAAARGVTGGDGRVERPDGVVPIDRAIPSDRRDNHARFAVRAPGLAGRIGGE